ncbi:MAG: hypothetical protein CMO01_16195 [Thalassobius sp.]|nr:hypothetical protein [Thalassovita sp.]
MKYLLVIISILCIQSIGYSQKKCELLDFKAITLCDSIQVFLGKVRPTIVEKKWEDDIFEITIRTITNCATKNMIGSFILTSDTLYLMHSIGDIFPNIGEVQYQNGYTPQEEEEVEIDLCDCYSQLNYRFKLPYQPENIKLFSKKLYPPSEIYPIVEPTYEVYKGDIINRTDSIGNQEGIWLYFDSLGILVQEENYKNGVIMYTKYIDYYENGFVKEELIDSDSTVLLTYHETGYLEKQCVSKRIEYDLLSESYKKFKRKRAVEIETCFSYDEKGQLIEVVVEKK